MWIHLQTVAWQQPRVFAMTSAGMPFAVITTACRTRRVCGLSALAASLASSSTVKPCIFVILIRGIGTLHLSSPLMSILPAREGKTYREVLTIALVIYRSAQVCVVAHVARHPANRRKPTVPDPVGPPAHVLLKPRKFGKVLLHRYRRAVLRVEVVNGEARGSRPLT